MITEEYTRMHKLENTYWWFVGRRYIIASLLSTYLRSKKRNLILDVGCGTGGNLPLLQRWGAVKGVDISEQALRFCREIGFTDLHQLSADKLTFIEESFDLVTAFDLLEHLDDDSKTLKELFRVCKKGGMLMLTVPAYQFLWSEHDIFLRHKRRYSADILSKKVREAGFKIEKLSYIIFFLLLPIFYFRFLQKIIRKREPPRAGYIMLPWVLNQFFIFLLQVESLLVRKINFPCGVSIICIARKL